jgi:hypothetical protein
MFSKMPFINIRVGNAYVDDFVILSHGHAAEALAWTKAVMTRCRKPASCQHLSAVAQRL